MELMRNGEEPTQVHSNCSGKHAGMLATCKIKGYPLQGYRDPDHPLQSDLLGIASEMTEVPKSDIALGVDGCGVVVWGLPIQNMALGFAKMAKPEAFDLSSARRQAVKTVVGAIQGNPVMISGKDRFSCRLIQATGERMVAKGGAQGVFCLGILEQGLGLALKVEDGNGRRTAPATLEALVQMGQLCHEELEELSDLHKPVNKNVSGEEVGEIRPVVKLKSCEL